MHPPSAATAALEESMKKTMMAMALVAGVIAAGEVGAQGTLDDGQVFALFDEANTADIWTARLALAKTRSAGVRQLASMVVADHESVQHMARELAKKLRVTVAPPPGDTSAEALAAALKALQSKTDGEFDRAYLAHELSFHRAAIDAVRGTLLPAAKNAELRALLQNVLGGFEHHLAETRRVADAMGVR
jgi:putative membrane protein